LRKYTLHMKLMEECWQKFDAKDLKDIGDIEQTLATGLDKEGKSPNTSKLMTQISARLSSEKLDRMDKLRLALITIMSLDMVEKDRKALTQTLEIEDQKAIQNLI